MTCYQKYPPCKGSSDNAHLGQGLDFALVSFVVLFFFSISFVLFFIFSFIIWSLSKRFAFFFFKLEGEYECHKYFIFIAHLALFLTFRPCQQSTQ